MVCAKPCKADQRWIYSVFIVGMLTKDYVRSIPYSVNKITYTYSKDLRIQTSIFPLKRSARSWDNILKEAREACVYLHGIFAHSHHTHVYVGRSSQTPCSFWIAMSLSQSSSVETTHDWKRILFMRPFAGKIAGRHEESWWLRMAETCRIGRCMNFRFLQRRLYDYSNQLQYLIGICAEVADLQDSLVGDNQTMSTMHVRGRVLHIRLPTNDDALDFELSLRELMVYYSGVSPV